jgi:sulfur-oxidizing protein SoxB
MEQRPLSHSYGPRPWIGCFDLSVYIRVENPKGVRVRQTFSEGAPLNRELLYTAAFITMQGVPEKHGRNRRDLEVRAVDTLESYFAKHPGVSVGIRNSVVST